MYPCDKMPIQLVVKDLLIDVVKCIIKKTASHGTRRVESTDDYEPGTRKTKTDKILYG